VRRVELELAPGVVVEFVDRERALGQVEEFAEEGTRWPVVVFGPEGCGKTAFLRQAAAMLRGTTSFTSTPWTGFFRRRWTTQTSRGSSLTS
jgi:ABC-type taurine transport system ATPase subunit